MKEKDIFNKMTLEALNVNKKIPNITIYALFIIFATYGLEYISFSNIILLYKIAIIISIIIFSYIIKRNFILSISIISISLFMYFKYFVFQFNSIKNINDIKTTTGIITNKTEVKNKFLYTLKTKTITTKKNKFNDSHYIKLISHKKLNITDYVICKNIYQIVNYKNKEQWKKNRYGQGYASFIMTNSIKVYKQSIYYEKIYQFIKLGSFLKDKISKQVKYFFTEQPLFKTIFLGGSNKDQKIKKIFNTWGIMHYLARSGVHIQILISFISLLLLFLGIHYKKIIYFESVILLIFYFLSFQSISFLRAMTMFFISKICLLLEINTTPLHIVSGCAIIFFFLNPYCFFLLSTQLTFICTFILAIINYKQYQI